MSESLFPPIPRQYSFRATHKSPPVVDLNALQDASRLLQDSFVKDAHVVPDLGEMLTAPGGLSSASYSAYPDDYRVPFQKRKLLRVPDTIWQYYTRTNHVTHMGILPEIDRVWITIDHKLFLWDYVEGSDLISFVDQPNIITHVTLIPPKPHVFVNDISHVLVVCTGISVLLIGTSYVTAFAPNGRLRKEIQLYATGLSVATEFTMSSVVGTGDGRIFMCGSQDGNLYELHYQEKEGWFDKRTQLINHSIGGVQSLFPRLSSPSPIDRISSVVSDPFRNCFYTLASKNIISMYRPTGDKTIELIQTMSGLFASAQEKAPADPAIAAKNFTILGLQVVHPDESRLGIQLVAITVNGVRMYFAPSTATPIFQGIGIGSSSDSLRPLQMIHLRLPPASLMHPADHVKVFVPSVQPNQEVRPIQPRTAVVSQLESFCYTEGLAVCSQQGDTEDDNDFLFGTAPDLTRIGAYGKTISPQQSNGQPQQQSQHLPWAAPSSYAAPVFRPPLTEHATLLDILGHTLGIASFPRFMTNTVPPGCPVPVNINELATQFSEPVKHVMILTDAGLSFIAKRRVLDYLRAVIEDVHAMGNIQPIMDFKESFGRDQTCAMLLGLASGNTFLDNDVPLGLDPAAATVNTLNPEHSTLAKQAFFDFGERPVFTERAFGATGGVTGTLLFSGRREGLALYFARLVRPFWKAQLTAPDTAGRQRSNISDRVLAVIQKNLHALKDFLDKNPHLFHLSPGDLVVARTTTLTEQDAWKTEHSSVQQLLSLLSRTIEALSFFLLLCDYRIEELIAACGHDVQSAIRSLTFEGLITTAAGQSVSRALVNVVIDKQIGNQISIDAISEILQQRCGSFCSADDVLLYKARENVRKAGEIKYDVERQRLLEESLRFFLKAARILDFDQMCLVVGQYQNQKFTKGAIEFPISCAQIVDPDSIGVEFWQAGLPINDQRAQYYERRLRCYDLALDSITLFEKNSNEAKTQPGNSSQVKEAEAIRIEAYRLALSSEDQLFHASFYDWLAKKGMADNLLDTQTPFLEEYLKRDPPSVQKYQLLWQLYVKNDQSLRAAEVLATMAESTRLDVSLESRLEYLTLAVANAKSHPISIGAQHESAITFLTDLEEKLDVAQVQLEMYNTLFPKTYDPDMDSETREKITVLAKKLFTMSELYQGLAEPFNLPVMKLLILHVSEHRDENLVRPIWNQIFDEALEGGKRPRHCADLISKKVVPLGQRFYPSHSAFPLRHIATLLVRFALANKGEVPTGWAPRVLVQCGVPYGEIWNVLHEMYESQIPPFNDQANIQAVSSDIAILLQDWLEARKRPQMGIKREDFPIPRIQAAVDTYMKELDVALMPETLETYENLRRGLRTLR